MSKYYDSNKLVVGKMKNETGSVAIKEFPGLKPKIYSFLVDNSSEDKKEKGVNKNFAEKITHNEQKDILLNNKCLKHSMNRIQSKDHRIGTYETNKPFVLLWWWNIYPKQWIWWISSWRLELIIRKLIKQLILTCEH